MNIVHLMLDTQNLCTGRYMSTRSEDYLSNLADKLHLSLEECHGAFAGPELCKLLVCTRFAGLGIPIPAEEPFGYMLHPFLGLPPGPEGPLIWIAWHALLRSMHIILGAVEDLQDCHRNALVRDGLAKVAGKPTSDITSIPCPQNTRNKIDTDHQQHRLPALQFVRRNAADLQQ